MKTIVFDTETTGKYDFKSDPWAKHQPHLVQLAASVHMDGGASRIKLCLIIKPDGWTIPAEAAAIHGITTEMAWELGVPLLHALSLFTRLCDGGATLVAHNRDFDIGVLGSSYHRVGRIESCPVDGRNPTYCTMRNGTALCKIPGNYGDYKWPKLAELHKHLFGTEHTGQHDALGDVEATARCYFEMAKREICKGIKAA